jgi:4-diphosphocytidyl-2-C-methyl-D-erythritol kinase
MRLRAMAKINLGLDVLRKREDGYHEVRMIMQTIQMYDLLDIRKKSEPGIILSTNLPYVPSDERNLVYKAAKLLMDEFEVGEGLSMKLTKSIPVAAGMAGGSSDAAAAFVLFVDFLKMICKIFKTGTAYFGLSVNFLKFCCFR